MARAPAATVDAMTLGRVDKFNDLGYCEATIVHGRMWTETVDVIVYVRIAPLMRLAE